MFSIHKTHAPQLLMLPKACKENVNKRFTFENTAPELVLIRHGKRDLKLVQGAARHFKCVKHWFLIFSWYTWEEIHSPFTGDVLATTNATKEMIG